MLRRMNATIRHRGPDGDGYFDGPGADLAFQRLAIIDLERGWQPIYNEDRSVVISFNGEIYNHQDIRAELAGRHQFSSAPTPKSFCTVTKMGRGHRRPLCAACSPSHGT